MARAKGTVVVSERQQAALERLVRAYKTPQHVAQRARIVLMSANGLLNVEQAEAIRVDAQRVRRWRRRWAERQAGLMAAESEGASDADLDALVWRTLSDEYRSGTPPRITAEQIARIISVACEKPSDCGRPVSHWTPRELADEVIRRGIVDTISPRHVDRFFGGSRLTATQVAVLAQCEDQGIRSRGIQGGGSGRMRHVSNRT